MKRLAAGSLRHRIAIERRVETQDPVTGSITHTWATMADSQGSWDSVPASIEPLSAREFIAAQSTQSSITARIVIRNRPGVTAKMRAKHGCKIYSIEGVLEDVDSGVEYQTLVCSEGVNDG